METFEDLNSLEFLSYVFRSMGMAFSHDDDNLERNTNKAFLFDQFQRASKQNQQYVQANALKAVIAMPRNPHYFSPDVNVKLDAENVVDIVTLKKSVDQVLDGKVFLCRVIANPFKMAAVAFLAEDPAGERAVRVIIYNYPYALSSITIGDFMGIVNPYFKSTIDGGYALRSDKPSEVIRLSDELMKARFPEINWKSLSNESKNKASNLKHPPETTEDKILRFRREGNKHYIACNYNAAIACYTEGLLLTAFDQDLLANRSLCYLKTENFRSSLKDANLVLTKNACHVKAIYRAAKSHIGLLKYEKAKELLETKLQLDLVKDDLEKLLVATKEYIEQRDEGKYDMCKLYKSCGMPVIHEIADFMGPVKIVDVAEKGRGLVVTKDVSAGELLLCSKAFAIHYSNVSEGSLTSIDVLFSASSDSQAQLLNLVVKKITKDPAKGKEFYQLSAGSKLGRWDPKKNDCSIIDRERIDAVINVNGLEIPMLQEGGGHCYGLWVLQSYVNNDCFNCNATFTLFGNVCQVRSLKAMKKGDEVLIPYREHACPLWQRVLTFSFKDFICKCQLCRYETQEAEEKVVKRDGLLIKINDGRVRHQGKLKQVIKRLGQLSEGSPFADHYLAMPLYQLGRLLYDRGDYKNAIKAYTEFLDNWERFGGDITNLLYKASVNMFYMYFSLQDVENAQKLKGILLRHIELNFGTSDKKLVEAMFPGIGVTFAFLDA